MSDVPVRYYKVDSPLLPEPVTFRVRDAVNPIEVLSGDKWVETRFFLGSSVTPSDYTRGAAFYAVVSVLDLDDIVRKILEQGTVSEYDPFEDEGETA